jgi:hypothetical protein
MSRTWRTIPKEGEDGNFGKEVRDKDNHGCLYSRPKWWRKAHNRRMRSRTTQKLNDLANHTRSATGAVERGEFDDLVLPRPTEFQPYYW